MKSSSLQKLTTTFHGHCTLLSDGPHPVECASLWIRTNPPLTYHCVSHWIFAMRHQGLSFIKSWPGIMGFGWAQVPRERSWRTGGKSTGKNVLRNPLHNLLEQFTKYLTCAHSFQWFVLGKKKIKDRRTPTGFGNSYWGSADSENFGTYQGVTLGPRSNHSRVPELHPLPLTCSQGVQGNKKREIVKELRFH